MGTLRVAVVTLAIAIPITADAQSVTSQWSWPVSSDFGPRINGGWDFHEGVDFNPVRGDADIGTPIPNLEDGVVFQVGNNPNFIEVVVRGSNTGQKWFYGHLFRKSTLTVPEAGSTTRYWQLKRGVELANPADPTDRVIGNVIIRRDSLGAISAVTSLGADGRWIVDGNSFIKDISGNNLVVRALVYAGDLIAPMGDSFTDNVHLHLGLNYGVSYPYDNPYFELQHSFLSASASIQFPADGQVFGSQDLTQPKAFSVRVNSTGGLDLDKVDFFIYRNGDSYQPIHIGTLGQATFGFGGQPAEGVTGAGAMPSDGTQNGVEPLDADPGVPGLQPGLDNFVFQIDLNTISNGAPLPDGEHKFIVRCRDVNNNSECLAAGGNGTSVSFAIASPDSSTRTA